MCKPKLKIVQISIFAHLRLQCRVERGLRLPGRPGCGTGWLFLSVIGCVEGVGGCFCGGFGQVGFEILFGEIGIVG